MRGPDGPRRLRVRPDRHRQYLLHRRAQGRPALDARDPGSESAALRPGLAADRASISGGEDDSSHDGQLESARVGRCGHCLGRGEGDCPLEAVYPTLHAQARELVEPGRVEASLWSRECHGRIGSTRLKLSVIARAPGPRAPTARDGRSTGDLRPPRRGVSSATTGGALCRGRGTSPSQRSRRLRPLAHWDLSAGVTIGIVVRSFPLLNMNNAHMCNACAWNRSEVHQPSFRIGWL